MAGSVDDERLVEQFKGHDESAFERIVKLQVLNTQLRQTESQLALATTFDLRVSQLRLIREAIDQGIRVTPIPGASAVTTALSAAGLPTHRFLFLGFPPPKKEATKKLMLSLEDETGTLIFYLPPRKLPSFLHLIEETLGDRQVVCAREMTKIFEEFTRGTPKELIGSLKKTSVKGEATVLIGPKKLKKSRKS